MPQINYLNLPAIARAASDVRGADVRNLLAEEQLRGYTQKREREGARRNILAEHYAPPGTRTEAQPPMELTDPNAILQPRTIPQPGRAVTTPGGLDRPAAINALYGAGDFEGAQALEAEETTRLQSTANLQNIYLKIRETMGKLDDAGQKRLLDSFKLAASIARPLNAKYDKLIAGGMSHEEATFEVDKDYDKGVERMSKAGISVQNLPQTFDRNASEDAITLKERLDLEFKGKALKETVRHHKALEKKDKTKDDSRLWGNAARAALNGFYGKMTEGGYELNPAKSEEYSRALELLETYRGQGMTPNAAAVKARSEAKQGTESKGWKGYLPE